MKKEERSVWTGGDLAEAPKEGEILGACDEVYKVMKGNLREIQTSPDVGMAGKISEINHYEEMVPQKSAPATPVADEILEPEEMLEEVTEIESEPEKTLALEIKEFEEVEFPPSEARVLLGPKMEKALLLLLKSLIESGMEVGWDNRSRHLKKKFSEVSVAQGGLNIVVGVLELSKEEACVICNFLRKTVPLMGEEDEEAVRDAILKIIFPHCCFE